MRARVLLGLNGRVPRRVPGWGQLHACRRRLVLVLVPWQPTLPTTTIASARKRARFFFFFPSYDQLLRAPHTFSFLSRVLCHDNRVVFDASCIETGIQCSPIEPPDRGSSLNRGKKKKEENGGAVSRPRSKLRKRRERRRIKERKIVWTKKGIRGERVKRDKGDTARKNVGSFS